MNQQQLSNIASKIMGWKVVDKPIENSDTNETYFFFTETGTPICAEPYRHNSAFIINGGAEYGLTWHTWNPLANPVAWYQVMDALRKIGYNVDLYGTNMGWGCIIHTDNWSFYQNITAAYPGEAICACTMRLVNSSFFQETCTGEVVA